jgi:predicted RNA binding protein YcfA (HicA-like mRNA interferase family)
MSKKLPAVTDRVVIKAAKKLGFTFYRQAKGSHEVWRRVSDVPGIRYCVNKKSREKEHRGGEKADKTKAIHYSD